MIATMDVHTIRTNSRALRHKIILTLAAVEVISMTKSSRCKIEIAARAIDILEPIYNKKNKGANNDQ